MEIKYNLLPFSHFLKNTFLHFARHIGHEKFWTPDKKMPAAGKGRKACILSFIILPGQELVQKLLVVVGGRCFKLIFVFRIFQAEAR